MKLSDVPNGQLINFQVKRKKNSKIKSFHDVWGVKKGDYVDINVIANINDGNIYRANVAFDMEFLVTFPESFQVSMLNQKAVIHEAKP